MTNLQPSPRYMDLNLFAVEKDFRGRSAIFVQLWWLVQSLLIHTSPQFMYGWRRFLWRLFGAKLGETVLIRPSARVTYPWKVKVGAHSWIGDNVVLYSLAPIEIGDNSVISQGTHLCAGTHDYTKIDFPLIARSIIVENEVWIAASCFVAPGITIKRGAIIGACSVVLNDVKEATICAGNPAREIRHRP